MPALWHPQVRPLATGQDGFAIVELMTALLILTVGTLGMFMGFISSQKVSLVAEQESSMAHIAQQQIEYVEGMAYSQIGLSSTPGTSTVPTNPDYFVSGGNFQWNRSTGATEPLDVDTTTPGAVAPVQSWQQGRFSGQVYDFVTWTADPKCSPGCSGTQNYKRITVAVTLSGGGPHPLFISSVIADPAQAPNAGTSNGTAGNPLNDPSTSCTNAAGQTVSCTSPIDSGNPNTYYLHDWAASNSGSPQAPSSDHDTHATVGTASNLVCTTLPANSTIPADITGCPVPDLMDSGPPSGTTATPLYHYSTDQLSSSSYPGGRILQPTCSGLCTGNTGAGTDSTSDCSGGAWSSNLLNVQSQFWVSSPLTASATLTGDGGLSMYTQSVGSVQAVVSFCLEIYDIPPSSGTSGSLADILAWPPVALGGAGYVAATDPATGGNWPTSPSQVSYIFNFRGSGGTVSLAAGHRIGVRIWMKANLNNAIDLLYDNPNYPSQIQLNTE